MTGSQEVTGSTPVSSTKIASPAPFDERGLCFLSSVVLVLNFHRVELAIGLEITCLGPARFDRLLRMLAATDLKPAATGHDPLSPGTGVVLTFDDGFASLDEHALPALRRRGWTAIVFLIAEAVGKADDWDIRLLGRRRAMMGWSEIQQWSRAGIEFGSHTLTHADLTALSPWALRRELVDSRSRIADHLGKPVRYLAYPFGRADARVRAAAQEAGYEAAFAAGGDIASGSDRFAVPRVNVYSLTSLYAFRSLVLLAERGGLPSGQSHVVRRGTRHGHWWGRGRTRLFASLSAGSAVISNWRRRLAV